MQIMKCLVQGPARVGKTHVKALIMKKKLEEGKSPSTDCVEQAVRAVCTEKFAEDAESFQEVNAEELMKMLTKEIKHQHESPSSPPRKKHKSTEPSSSVQSHEMPEFTDTDGDVKLFVEEFQGLLSNCGGVRMYQKWIYFVDSGGQPQFHNVFQAFVQNTSVLLLVFDLTKKLSDSNMHCIQDKEGHDFQNLPGNTAQRVEDVLKSIASTIASQPKEEEKEKEEEAVEKKEDRAVAKKDKRAIFLVGTFKDRYEDLYKQNSQGLETIEEKKKKLGGLFKKSEIQKIGRNLIFPVNGLQAERGEFNDEMVCAIREKIHEHLEETKPHPIPIRWFALELALEKKATSLNQKVLSYEECKAVANTLHISDLQVALEFLQDCSLLLFYPDLDLVFTDPQALLKFFSDIVIKFIRLRDKFLGCATEVDNFQKAILSFRAAEILFDKSCSPVLTCDKALKIFQKLLIAAKTDEGNYFIPALLPMQDIHEARAQGEALSAKSSLVPLVFLFSDNCTPSGLFCAVIVKLLSSNWEVDHTEAKAYSNVVTLLRKKCNPELAITLIDSFKSFEVHCSKENKLPEIKNEIEIAIESVIHSRKYKCGPPQIAFFCPCSKCQFATLGEKGDISCECGPYPPKEAQQERKWLQGVSLFFKC